MEGVIVILEVLSDIINHYHQEFFFVNVIESNHVILQKGVLSTAQRYIHHKERNHKIALFVREYKKENGYTAPFVFLGTAEYVSHSGNKPMSFVWRLKEAMPAFLVPKANKNII